MSRSSAEPVDVRGSAGDRAAVEPLAALVAVLVVGAALGLYAGALVDATADQRRPSAEATLDRVERTAAVGGVVVPDRLRDVEGFRYPTTVTVAAGGTTWRVASGADAPAVPPAEARDSLAVSERPVTVRVGLGQNARGTLRVVVRR